MRLKVLNYDKDKAIGKFIYFKLLELLGLFIFIFGFETFGRYAYEKVWHLLPSFEATTYLEFWTLGAISILLLMLSCMIVYYVGYGIYLLLTGWFKLNWEWAKRVSEDEDSKIERLSEQKKLKEIIRIEEIEEQRKEYGYCAGDKIILKKQTEIEEYDDSKIKKMYGKKATIKKMFHHGNFDIEEIEEFSSEDGAHCNKTNVKKVIKKILTPKKPKLNKIREKEVKERKK